MPDDVLSPFIRARHAWEASDTDEAVRILSAIIADGGPGFWASPHTIKAYAPGPFESFVVSRLIDDDLFVPFDVAVARLWRALPGQYAVHALDMRQSYKSDVDAKSLAIIYQAAADGLLSNLLVDHADVAWIVVRAPDYAHLAEILDWGRFDTCLREARVRGARAAFLRAQPRLATNLLLYGVFYRTEAVYPLSVLDRLTRCRESDPGLFAVASGTLAEWATRHDAGDIVRVGLRNADGTPEYLSVFAQALASGSEADLTDFVTACVPDRPYVPRTGE